MKKTKILVTGGAGFIGSNLVEALLNRGDEVVALDDFSTGRRKNIESFLSRQNFTLIEGDICNIETCRHAVEGVDFVLHQAALGSVPRSIANPVRTCEVNLMGFVNMLYASIGAKVKRFVYAASSSTYGDSPDLPKREDVIGKPLSPYAVTKYADELFAENFARVYGIECIGLRYFNVFGRRQTPEGAYAAVIPKFAASLLRHEAPVILGDGSYSRDFTYIDNVIEANLLALAVTTPEAVNQVYNIACGGETTLLELFAMLKRHLSALDPAIAMIEPGFAAPRAGDVPHSRADVSKAERLLGYRPRIDVKEGIGLAAAYYFENL